MAIPSGTGKKCQKRDQRMIEDQDRVQKRMRNQHQDKLILISLSRLRGSSHYPNKKVLAVTGKINSGSI